MAADIDRREERRRLNRRSGDERRHSTVNRRRSDAEQLITFDEEEAVRFRMLARSGQAERFDPDPEPRAVAGFDEFAERPQTMWSRACRLLIRWIGK